jgi:hypothetical protein
MSLEGYIVGTRSGEPLFYQVHPSAPTTLCKAIVFYFHGIDESVDTPG